MFYEAQANDEIYEGLTHYKPNHQMRIDFLLTALAAPSQADHGIFLVTVASTPYRQSVWDELEDDLTS